MEYNKIYNEDCLVTMERMEDGFADLTLTDIPYGEVNRESHFSTNNMDKGDADIVTFDLVELTNLICRKTKGTVYMFCGIGQVSTIYKAMIANKLSCRLIVWEKTNPAPMNGDKIWLSGIECCVFGKKSGATFNGHCDNTVLRYPIYQNANSFHPTMKPIELFKKLIYTSTNKGDLVYDPFMGSGTTAIAAHELGRRWLGSEINPEYVRLANRRIEPIMKQQTLNLF